MSKVFDVDFRTGSIIDKVTGAKGVNVGNKITKQEKGLVYSARQSNLGEVTFDAEDTTMFNFGTNPFSVVCAFKMGKFNNIGSVNNVIFGKGVMSGSAGIDLYYKSTQKLIWGFGDGNGNTTVITYDDFGNLYDGKYHLAILTFDGTTYRCYLDNIKESNESTSVKDIYSSSDLFIGRENTTIRRSNSDILYLRAYNHALTAQERTKLYKEFVNSQPAVGSKKEFNYSKPTDLSSEKENHIETVWEDDFSSNTYHYYTANSDKTYDGTNELMRLESTQTGDSSFGFYTTNDVEAGKKYLITFRAKGNSNHEFFSIGDNGNNGTALKNPVLNSNWQEYSFIIEPTSSLCRFYTRGNNTKYFEIDDIKIQEYKGLIVAYNMIPQNGTLVDISGNGNNLDRISNNPISTDEGVRFESGDGYCQASETPVYENLPKWTIMFRLKKENNPSPFNFFQGNSNSAYGGLVLYYDGKVAYRETDGSYSKFNNITSSDLDDKWLTYTFTGDGSIVNAYINGKLVDTVTPASGNTNIGLVYLMRGYKSKDSYCVKGILADYRTYNYVLDDEKIKAYHNQFVKPILLEDFSGNGADGIVKTPKGWVKGTGEYKIGEFALEQGELVTNGGFDTDTWWQKQTGWSISGGTANLDGSNTSSYAIFKTGITTQGKKYRVKYTIKSISNGSFFAGAGNNFGQHNSTVGTYVSDIIAGSSTNIGIYGTPGTVGSIDNVSVVEIPPLEDLTTGTKYLECSFDGAIGVQSKQAYGTWEFDACFKNNVSYFTSIIAKQVAPWNTSGQETVSVYSPKDRWIGLLWTTSAGANYLAKTEDNYLDDNTWYKIKVVRLPSEGVFKDIPTLQTSDLVTNGYTEFTSNGKYGFHAINDGSGVGRAGTADEIDFVIGGKYLVEFDLKLNSGSLPNMYLTDIITHPGLSPVKTTQEGKNAIICVPSSSFTGLVKFYNDHTATDYEVSNLTIKRIYPKDTFAVFIKGGDFGNDEWTLVDTTGGLGSNPVTDSTYTTSEYFVLDLDSGDKFTNLKIKNGVEQ